MGKHFFTAEQEDYIRANYLNEPASQMSLKFGLGKGIISRYLKRNNLIVPAETISHFRKMNKPVISCITQFDDFLRENYLKMPIKTMARAIGKNSDITVRTRMRQLGLVVPPELASQRLKDGMYRKGHTPFNKGKKLEEYLSPEQIANQLKTSFKKGHVPVNKTPIGTIKIRSYGGANMKKNPNYKIKWIKIGEGSLEWMPLHIYNWINSGNEIPKGYVLSFKNGDSINAQIDNLELITMTENMKRNSIRNLPQDLQDVLMAKGQLMRQINKYSKEKS